MDFTPFIENLNYLIRSRGCTITEACIGMGVSPSTLPRYLCGSRTPDLKMIVKIAQYFNVSIDWLLGLEQNEDDNVENKSAIAKLGTVRVNNLVTRYALASDDDQKIVDAILFKYKE